MFHKLSFRGVFRDIVSVSAIMGSLIALMCTCVVALPGYAASGGFETLSGSSAILGLEERPADLSSAD